MLLTTTGMSTRNTAGLVIGVGSVNAPVPALNSQFVTLAVDPASKGARNTRFVGRLSVITALLKIVPKYSFWDAVAFLEVAQPVVVGLEYAQVRQTYGDGVQVKNSRVALSTYFIFY